MKGKKNRISFYKHTQNCFTVMTNAINPTVKNRVI